MFVLPSILLGLAIAVAIGGKPARLLDLQFRGRTAVLAALGLQLVLFSRPGEGLPERLVDGLHLFSYGLLVAFGVLNRRVRALWLFLAGLMLNAAAIAANGGEMPLSPTAAAAAGITEGANVDAGADRLVPLGDVFALPSGLPLANAFSIGDVLIGIGMVLLIVHGSVQSPFRSLLRLRRLRAPLASSDFRALALGRFVSIAGDWLTTAALIGWIYAASGSTLWVALVLLARIAPPILGGGVAAMIADRVPKRTLLLGVEVARGVAVAAAAVAVLADSRVGVLVCVAASGGLAALTSSVVPAFVPAVVRRRRYEAANALLGVLENVGMGVGALCGGLALNYVGAAEALFVDAATFVVAAAIFARIRARAVVEEGAGDDDRGALRYVLGHRRLAAAIGCFAAAIVATGLMNATLPSLLGDDLGAGVGSYGYALAAIGLGLAVGQLAIGCVRIGDGGMRWLGVALALMAGMFGLLAGVEHAPTAFLLLAAIGFLDGTTDGVFDTVVQRDAAPGRHGAIFGVASATFSSAMLVSVAAAPALNGLAAANVVVGVSALALLAASAIAWSGTRSAAGATPQPRRAPQAA